MTELLTILGWIGSLVVITSYIVSTVRRNPLILHWGNVIAALILVPAQLLLGVAFAAVLSLCFGTVGAVALYKHWREPSVKIVSPQGITTFAK